MWTPSLYHCTGQLLLITWFGQSPVDTTCWQNVLFWLSIQCKSGLFIGFFICILLYFSSKYVESGEVRPCVEVRAAYYPARPSCCSRWCSCIYLKKKHAIYFSRSDLPQTVDKNHKSWKGSYNFQPHHSVPFTWLGFKRGESMSWIHKVCVCLMDCVRFLSPGGDCYSAIKRCFSARGISRWMCSSWLLMGPLVWAATAALRTSRRSVGLCLTAITL